MSNAVINCPKCNQFLRITLEDCSEKPKKAEISQEMKVITYKDDKTLKQTFDSLMKENDIKFYEYTHIDSFFPINTKTKERLQEEPTGKIITEKTPNVLNLTPDMCNRSADDMLETPCLSPIAWLYWFIEEYKQGRYLDEKTWTQFPNWRDTNGGVLDLSWSPDSREVFVRRWHPSNAHGDVGQRALLV